MFRNASLNWMEARTENHIKKKWLKEGIKEREHCRPYSNILSPHSLDLSSKKKNPSSSLLRGETFINNQTRLVELVRRNAAPDSITSPLNIPRLDCTLDGSFQMQCFQNICPFNRIKKLWKLLAKNQMICRLPTTRRKNERWHDSVQLQLDYCSLRW